MEQKAADKLDRIQRDNPRLVTARVVLPFKGHAAIFHRQQPSIGDCNPMRVAGQILQHLLRAAEWWFDVDHPLDPFRFAAQSFERGWLGPTRPFSLETPL